MEIVKKVTEENFSVEETSRRGGDLLVLVTKAERLSLHWILNQICDLEYIVMTAW
ncbi:MAG: hypothetical protein QXL51_02585 [Candidatus Aenigmatarchaeota archaeon]